MYMIVFTFDIDKPSFVLPRPVKKRLLALKTRRVQRVVNKNQRQK